MRDVFLATWNVTQGLLLIGLYVLMYQIIKQQGRLLLRLDEMDRASAPPGQSLGLLLGTHLEEFRLPDLEGRIVSSGDLLGKRALLIHWGPACGFCELLAPELVRIHGDLTARGVQLILASRDGAEANRNLAKEHGLQCSILLMAEDGPLARGAFLHQGTPVAYLIDEEGRVARPLAVGGDAILDLAREVVGETPGRRRLPGERPLSESRIERDGLKAGTPAPKFRLPDLHGGMVELETYRGRRVLLIFTDPHCGPCEELAPQLARLQRRCLEGGLELIMVARGDVDENRQKADAHGFQFPVVLQDRWKLSSEYGIFAVPVAFLIGEDGVIAREVARGGDQILALLPQGLTAGMALSARSLGA